jgi:hypothetical protein
MDEEIRRQSWRRRPTPRFPLLLLVLALALLATGCGGSSAVSNGQPDTAAASPTTASAPAETSEPLQDVGTLLASDGQGTTIKEHFRLGALAYSDTGAPPPAVLDACNANFTTTIAQSVYAPGEITVGYTQGDLPTTLTINPKTVVQSIDPSNPLLSSTAFDIDGQWQCYSVDATPITVVFQPHEQTTYPIWVLLPVLSNATPRVTQAMQDSWQFNAGAIAAGGYTSIRASGNNAADCGGTAALMLYAQAPFNAGSAGTCQPVAAS